MILLTMSSDADSTSIPESPKREPAKQSVECKFTKKTVFPVQTQIRGYAMQAFSSS